MKYSRHFLSCRSTSMKHQKRGRDYRVSSSSSGTDDVVPNKKTRRIVTDLLDWSAVIPDQILVQVLLASQFDLSTTAWMFSRVSRRWRDAISRHTFKRWTATDQYHPFLWTKDPGERSGLVPPMVPLLEEWGRQGWLGLLKWAHGLGFPMLHRHDEKWIGRHTLLAAACLGGHQPVAAWVLDDLGGFLLPRDAVWGASRSGNDALLRWLIEERHVDPFSHIPWDENPASRGNLEMCQWLVWHCRSHFWLSGAGRNDHRHILEWAISEGYAVDWLVWPVLLCLAHCPRTHYRPGVRRRQGGLTRWNGCGGDWAAIRQPMSGVLPSGWQPRLASCQR